MTTADPHPPGPRDWKCDYNPTATEVHIRPRNDHIWHSADDDCPCGPTSNYLDIDSPCRWLIVHHALDRRPGSQTKLIPTPAPTAGYDGDDGPCAVTA